MAPQPESQQPSDAIDRRAQRGAPTPSPDNVRSWRPVLPLGHGSGLRPRNCRSAQHRPASAETARSEAADGTPGPRRTYPIRSRPGLGQHLEPPPVRGLFTGPPSRIQTRIHSTAPLACGTRSGGAERMRSASQNSRSPTRPAPPARLPPGAYPAAPARRLVHGSRRSLHREPTPTKPQIPTGGSRPTGPDRDRHIDGRCRYLPADTRNLVHGPAAPSCAPDRARSQQGLQRRRRL